jgi:hypothetical protein
MAQIPNSAILLHMAVRQDTEADNTAQKANIKEEIKWRFRAILPWGEVAAVAAAEEAVAAETEAPAQMGRITILGEEAEMEYPAHFPAL